MTKKQFEKQYYSSTSQKVADYFNISRVKVYEYVKQFGLTKKSTIKKEPKWFSKIPSTPEEYHKKWAKEKNKNWWQKAYNDMMKYEFVRRKVLDEQPYEYNKRKRAGNAD